MLLFPRNDSRLGMTKPKFWLLTKNGSFFTNRGNKNRRRSESAPSSEAQLQREAFNTWQNFFSKKVIVRKKYSLCSVESTFRTAAKRCTRDALVLRNMVVSENFWHSKEENHNFCRNFFLRAEKLRRAATLRSFHSFQFFFTGRIGWWWNITVCHDTLFACVQNMESSFSSKSRRKETSNCNSLLLFYLFTEIKF